MTDVRMPDGTVITNVPDGITQADLLRRLGQSSPIKPGSADAAAMSHPSDPMGHSDARQSIGPPGPGFPSDSGLRQRTADQVHEDFMQGENKLPFFDRYATRRNALPMLAGGIGSIAGPGGTWAGLALSSLAAGGLAGGGELAAQKLSGEQLDPKTAAIEGGKTAAGNFIAGGTIKALGDTAKALFYTPLDNSQKAGAQFAKDSGLPFPLSSAAPGTAAGNIQQASRGLLPGDIKTQLDANKVAQFLNREVSTIQANGSPIDEAAAKGQQFLRQVFAPGESVYTDTFKGFRSAVGDNTPIELTATKDALQRASESLKNRGETKALFNRIRTIVGANADSMTAEQLDNLYSGILKDVARNANARPEGNAILNAISEDMDTVGKTFGVDFSGDLAQAKSVRDQFRALRDIPGLERLSKDFGDKGGTLGSRQWMAELFGNPNGKALGELRNQNPDLYHELADSWLASNISRFSKDSNSSMGRALDGKALREWFDKNQANVKLILGAPQAKALDSFTNYASTMSGAVNRASSDATFNPLNLLSRGGVEAAGAIKAPWLMLPSEAGSYVLAKGLSDPNSALFRLFTEGVKPSTLRFIQMGSALSGQEAARGQDSR